MAFSSAFIQRLLRLRRSILLIAVSSTLMACAKQIVNKDADVVGQTPEAAYNITPISYSGTTIDITATATFNRYIDGATGLATVESALPIRYAEAQILDADKKVIQVTETNATGQITMRIPLVAGNYTLRVNSRANNNYYKVSVLKDPYSNEYHSLDTSFSLSPSDSGTKAVTITSAPATNGSGTLGGAFNILDQIFIANEFLRSQAYTADCPVCLNDFTVAPKVQIYWSSGISPGVYYGKPRVAISFFLSAYSAGVYPGLYIMGGVEGDLCTDTDHFDRSIILHEYGHFLEFVYSKASSPGGSHDGNSLIDPRLAWSEGWADFFQAAVLGRSYYRDTSRNAGCTSFSPPQRLSFPDFNLETQASTDVPVANEGIFREISIARTLYDVMTGPSQSATYNMTNNTDSKAADIGFSLIWHSFRLMADAAFKFQNMGIHNYVANAIIKNTSYNADYSSKRTDYDDVISHEKQVTTQDLYGRKLTPSGGSCTFSFAEGTVVPDVKDSSNYLVWSDPLRTNRFYRYDYDGNTNNGVIYLRYAKTGGTYTNPYDLDLYVYKENHVLYDTDDMAGRSEGNYPESGGTGYEAVDLRGKTTGTYMINVKVYYQGARADTGFYLETNSGARLCP